MPESSAHDHVKPYIHETLTTKSLHFSIFEIQSRMDIRRPYALELAYTRTMMGFLLFSPRPGRITMIGLGGGSLPKFCHRHLPGARIEVVESNPHVISLRTDFMVPPDSDRFTVVQDDAALYIRNVDVLSEVLLVDGFDSNGLPYKLSSQRFYDHCHDALSPNGVMAVNLHSRCDGFDEIANRIRRSFAGQIVVVRDSDSDNCIIFAKKGAQLRKPSVEDDLRPADLDDEAWAALRNEFERIVAAMSSDAS